MMNDEIKEILEELQRRNDRYNYNLKEDISFSDEDYKSYILLDYITNLQEENERLNHQLELQQELTERNRLRKHCYKSRIEKAVEYIKEHTDKLKTIRVPKIDFDYNKLLEILKGGNNENK